NVGNWTKQPRLVGLKRLHGHDSSYLPGQRRSGASVPPPCLNLIEKFGKKSLELDCQLNVWYPCSAAHYYPRRTFGYGKTGVAVASSAFWQRNCKVLATGVEPAPMALGWPNAW